MRDDMSGSSDTKPAPSRRSSRIALALTLAALSSCSHPKAPRRLAEHLPANACAVDGQYVYVNVDGALSKVGRKTGTVEFLTNDTRAVRTLLPVNGSLYWLDDDGVHAWDTGATTRRTVVGFSKDHKGESATIVHFKNRVCWGRDVPPAPGTYTWHVAVDCLELASARIVPWIEIDGLGVVHLAADADRIYAAIERQGARGTDVLDITDPTAPRVLATYPGTVVSFGSTPRGPVAVTLSDELRQTPASIWVALPRPHDVLASEHAFATKSIGEHTYALEDTSVTEIDLNSGKRTPLAATYGGVFCGDTHNLYVIQHDASKHSRRDDALIELPMR